MTPTPTRKSYAQVTYAEGGKRRVVRLHVLKFALHHGFIPPRVDHHNQLISDDRLANLRPATAAQNAVNTAKWGSKRDLPVGVRQARSGRFKAYGMAGGRQRHIGTFDTMEEASLAAREFRAARYGEDFLP